MDPSTTFNNICDLDGLKLWFYYLDIIYKHKVVKTLEIFRSKHPVTKNQPAPPSRAPTPLKPPAPIKDVSLNQLPTAPLSTSSGTDLFAIPKKNEDTIVLSKTIRSWRTSHDGTKVNLKLNLLDMIFWNWLLYWLYLNDLTWGYLPIYTISPLSSTQEFKITVRGIKITKSNGIRISKQNQGLLKMSNYMLQTLMRAIWYLIV